MWRKWAIFWAILVASASTSVVVVVGGLWALTTFTEWVMP